MAKITLTPQAYEKLKKELKKLETTERIKAVEAVTTAHGGAGGDAADLAQVAHAVAAREQLENRIAEIKDKLERAQVKKQSKSVTKIAEGNTFEIKFKGDRKPSKYKIGQIVEETGDAEIITPGSPLGTALLGAKPGDKVNYCTPGGETYVTVTKIG